MQTFRRKYLYNSQRPVFQNNQVKTFQCMNTQTKDQRFLILHHLSEPAFIDQSSDVLQPVQGPSLAQPFSVYNLVDCCSNIKKINEMDAMYILKCLIESKIKKPLYYLLSPQGICVSEVQGLLPEKSPSLFEIAINMLGISADLVQNQKSTVSKDGYEICRLIKNGQNPGAYFGKYGWKESKREKNMVSDEQYWIFKGRRKEEGPFGEEYGLAWHAEYNLCRFKYIDLSKDGYEDELYNDFRKKMDQFSKTSDKLNLLQVYKYQKGPKGIKIFTDIPSQGSLNDYLILKHEQDRTLTQKNSIGLLEQFIFGMRKLNEKSSFKAFGTLHLKNIYLHENRLVIGQPLLITDKVEKKLRELKNGVDYFSPELKQNIIFAENLLKLDSQKMDIWFFGFMLHKILIREVPIFDSTRKPILPKNKLSPGMCHLIMKCLSLTPANRPSWNEINLKQLQKNFVEDVTQEIEKSAKTVQIKLGTRAEKTASRQSVMRTNKIENQIMRNQKDDNLEDENSKLKEEQVEQKQLIVELPSTPKFKRFKLVLKTILVMLLYIFVYFRPFLARSIDMLLVRGYYMTVSIHLTTSDSTRLSTATILTNTPDYFMLNNISFQTLNQQLHCINNKFNSIHDPSYQIIGFVQSSSFLGLLLLGWIIAIVICVTKSISIWKGGIGNRVNKLQQKYWLVYGFYQLSLAALLFAHFYIFQFFYFSISQPCFGIQNFSGIEPFFDSSLYIFFGNTQKFMSRIFACLGILGIIMLFSVCFYSWVPKIDQKNFFSVLSIIFRMVPYVLFILFCRVGIFFVLNPSAINDQNKILELMVSSSFVGLIGVIPEIFVIGCVCFEVGYEYTMNWVEKKVIDSTRLSRFFNLNPKKKNTENLSKISKLQQSKINDMSFNQSKHQLVVDNY